MRKTRNKKIKTRTRTRNRNRKIKTRNKGKGLTAINYAEKAVLLNSTKLKPDEIKKIMKIIKVDDAARLIQYTNRTIGIERQEKKRIINLLLEYQAEHEEIPYSRLPFHIAGDNNRNLRDLLVRASKLNYTINDKKNKDLIKILGRTYWGLRDQQYGTYSERTMNIYSDIENAFIVLVKKIFSIDVNHNDYLDNDELRELLIDPLLFIEVY